MATFTFKWPHHAEEVYVTGTFDNWSKSEQLDKVGDTFEKSVRLPDASEKIYYKFVVDGNWTTDHTAPQEKDHEGNENNVLLPENMEKLEEAGPAAAVLNTVTPESTTAQLAGAVPLEHKAPEAAILNTVTPESTTAQLAGAVPLEHEAPAAGILNPVTPESTTAQLAGAVSLEDKDVSPPGGYPKTPATDLDKQISVNPLPAANGALNPIKLAPGEKIPDEVSAGSVTDNVTLDKESYEQGDRLPGAKDEFSVKPLPATDGALNPIKLAPGEKIPDEVSAGSTKDNITLDKESYEQSDRLPGTKDEFSVKPLPATDGALNPIQLAPGEKIPDEVSAGSVTDNVTLDKESYEQSDRLPGAKDEFSVNPLPATEGALNPIKLAPGEKIPAGATIGSITDNVTLDKESYEKSDRIPGIPTELPPISGNMIPESSLPILGPGDVTINTVTPESTTAALAGKVPLEPKVPEIVKESQEEAKFDPEASGISEEVKEKATVEHELLDKVPEVPSTSEGTAGKGTEKSEGDKTLTETAAAITATAGAAFVGTAIATKESAHAAALDAATKLPDPVKDVLPASLQKVVAAPEETTPEVAAPEVPTEVKESITAAGTSLEAAANPVAVEEKKEVEAQLLKEVEEVKPAAETSTKPEPPVVEAAKPTPVETNGAEAAPVSAPVEAAPASGSKATDAPTTAEKKKKNRLSTIFSKLKHKLEGKDKDKV